MTVKEFKIQNALGTLSDEMKDELAYNERTPKEILTKLSTDKYWWIRSRIAINPNTPKEILTILSTDECIIVRDNATENPNIPYAKK